MYIVIAPDSFKESLSAEGVAQAIARGVRTVAPQARVACVPMADGGEGSLDAVLAATGGERRHKTVHDANGQPCQADWGWLGQGRAFIEMASAAGLERIPPEQRRPLQASTRGVGELIVAALDAGARQIVIGLGGSATNDGGAGVLQALGVRLLDAQNRDLPAGGLALQNLHHIDVTGADARLAGVRFELAVDVDNPLCGPRGASAVFGPQKGATQEDVAALDAALENFAQICSRQFGTDRREQPGMGAAGGLGFGIAACFEASFRPGVELVAELAGLAHTLVGADLVFTGEGRMDAQTLHGKTPAGVARYAKEAGAPVIALAGALGAGYEALSDIGITAAFSLASGPMTLAQACEQAPALLAQRAGDCMRVFLARPPGVCP